MITYLPAGLARHYQIWSVHILELDDCILSFSFFITKNFKFGVNDFQKRNAVKETARTTFVEEVYVLISHFNFRRILNKYVNMQWMLFTSVLLTWWRFFNEI